MDSTRNKALRSIHDASTAAATRCTLVEIAAFLATLKGRHTKQHALRPTTHTTMRWIWVSFLLLHTLIAAAAAQPHLPPLRDRLSPPDPAALQPESAAVEARRMVEAVVRVQRADGSPAQGAVVLTSAGGQGVTDASGVARFPVAISAAAEAVQVTAAATELGVNHTGSVRAPVFEGADLIDAGVITLAEGSECEPDWLPTFGGATGILGEVVALTVFDDGSGAGPALYAGGNFTTAGGVSANFIARWNGQNWSPLGSGMDSFVHALTVFDDGSGAGPALYAGGYFTTAGGVSASRIARWNGQNWSPLGNGMNNAVNALTVFDDGSGAGPSLYAGGLFTTAGGVSASRIARWDGQNWSPLGGGMNGGVADLTVFDDGSGAGPALYAGGNFTTAVGVSANHIARWDGQNWSPLGSGMDSFVHALTVFDDGSGAGPALYAGGNFTTAGGVSANFIARWDGQNWSPLGSGMDSFVLALTVFDDGSGAGPALYAGGNFTTAGGVSASSIARWDGQNWSPLGSGIHGWVVALTVFDDGSGAGPALYVGGAFIASPADDSFLARWQGCTVDSGDPADLNGDGVVNGFDLMTLLSQWGAAGAADLNSDGVVNGVDLLTLLSNWGPVN